MHLESNKHRCLSQAHALYDFNSFMKYKNKSDYTTDLRA